MNIFKTEFSKILKAGSLSKTMTVRPDLCLVGSIIDYFKPQTVLEYGPFLGGWCLFVNSIANSNISICGIDNFYTHRWANEVSTKQGQEAKFPTTALDLENYIKTLSTAVFNQSIDIKIVEAVGSEFSTEKKFDLIRIDCAGYGVDEHYKIVTNSTKMLSDNGLLIIEDITPMHFAKLHSFLKAYVQKKIFPVVYGAQSIICAISEEKQQFWFDNLKSLQPLLDITISKIDNRRVWYVGAVVTVDKIVTDHNNNFVTYQEDAMFRSGKV